MRFEAESVPKKRQAIWAGTGWQHGPFCSGFEVRSSERLCKKSAERLMVGRKGGFAAPQPALSHFPIEVALCGGAKNQSYKDSTDFLHSLASC